MHKKFLSISALVLVSFVSIGIMPGSIAKIHAAPAVQYELELWGPCEYDQSKRGSQIFSSKFVDQANCESYLDQSKHDPRRQYFANHTTCDVDDLRNFFTLESGICRISER